MSDKKIKYVKMDEVVCMRYVDFLRVVPNIDDCEEAETLELSSGKEIRKTYIDDEKAFNDMQVKGSA